MFKFSFKHVAQICCSDLGLRLVAQIGCSNLLLTCSAHIAHMFCSGLLLRFVAQIHCSDLLLFWCADLLLSIVSADFNVQFQISNVHIQMQLELLLWFQTQFHIQSPDVVSNVAFAVLLKDWGTRARSKTEHASVNFI